MVVTIHRPPDAPNDFLTQFESLIKAIENENKEIYILGDLNCDLIKQNLDQHTKKLKSLFKIHQLTQLVNKATRITSNSSTVIDHFITNEPKKNSQCGVVHTGISDHSLIYAFRKINCIRENLGFQNTTEIRNMKRFSEERFLLDLSKQPWIMFISMLIIQTPDSMWEIWRKLFTDVLDKHAPIQKKKIKSKKVPWITSEIKKLIILRDKLKRKAIITKL